jgi:hypothetical protein
MSFREHLENKTIDEAKIVSMLTPEEKRMLKEQYCKMADAIMGFNGLIDTNVIFKKLISKDFQAVIKSFDKFDNTWSSGKDL